MAQEIVSPTVVRCGVYTRKSVEDEHDARFTSPQSQRQACAEFIKTRAGDSWITSEELYYEDYAYSGGNLERPGIRKLIQDIEHGLIDAVVVFDLDRLSRNDEDWSWFKKLFREHRVAFFSVQERMSGMAEHYQDFYYGLKMQVAQLLRRDSAVRVKQKLGAMAERGMRTGGNPISGYNIANKGWVPNEVERQQALDQFLIYREEKSLSKAADRLNRMGYRLKEWLVARGKNQGKKKGGGPYDKNNLDRLLRNPVYIGKIRFNGNLYQGQHQGIIPEDLFREVQELLATNRVAKNSRYKDKLDFWLKGLIRCAVCKSAMTPFFAYNKAKKIFSYFVCTLAHREGKDKCPVRRVPAKQIQAMIYGRLRMLGNCPPFVDKLLEEAKAQVHSRLPELQLEKVRIGEELKSLNQKGRNLAELLAQAGMQSDPFLIQSLKEVRERKEYLEGRLRVIGAEEGKAVEIVPNRDSVIQCLLNICAVFEKLRPEEKKEVAALLFRQIVYDHRDRQVVVHFYPLPGLPSVDAYRRPVFDASLKVRRGRDSNPR